MDEDLHRELIAALRLQQGWGADEALEPVPQDRMAGDRRIPAPTPARPAAVEKVQERGTSQIHHSDRIDQAGRVHPAALGRTP